MTADGTLSWFAAALVLATAAAVDLHRVETGSLTIYTTPALRDVLERDIAVRWQEQGHRPIEPVYVSAGEEYNRLRMSGDQPEADVFIHASPLYLAKGFDQGHMAPLRLPDAATPGDTFRSRLQTEDGLAWYAFAWSPLVAVYGPHIAQTPDLATSDLRWGLSHPTLSNNGAYAALFLEHAGADVGRHARNHAVVQPVNARTNILGVADGSFDVTLGYEAVARFFEAQGADIRYDVPLVAGKRVTTPVLFSVALVEGPDVDEARRFVQFLFTPLTQDELVDYHFRSVLRNGTAPSHLPDELPLVRFDWDDWRAVEDVLPRYEVVPGGR